MAPIEKNLSYNQKYRPTKQLQKDCLRQFRKWFPDLTDRIRFKEPLMHPDNFCFSISPNNSEFGDIIFDIDEQEITVFTSFDHHHYLTYVHEGKNEDEKIHKAIRLALTNIKDLVSGDIIIELEKKDKKIIKAFRYHKDHPDNKISAVINLNSDPIAPTERVTLNWNGILKEERLLLPKSSIDNAVASTKNKYLAVYKSAFRLFKNWF